MTFRHRILIAMAPLFVLLVGAGTTATFLIYHLGKQVDDILHENYDSVIFMRDLNEALERDRLLLSNSPWPVRSPIRLYKENWQKYQESLDGERKNITLPGEGELDDKLNRLSDTYRDLGKAFYEHPDGDRHLYILERIPLVRSSK